MKQDVEIPVVTDLLRDRTEASAISSVVRSNIAVSLLTGGIDKPYVFGLTAELLSKGLSVDVIGSDDLDCSEFHGKRGLNFLNLRGDQHPEAPFLRKLGRVSNYYARLIRYAAKAEPRIFHILWNNKFEMLDRTFLMLYYRFVGKKVALTAHNVNAGKRDAKDSILNRLTLRIQYHLADHIFVHTGKMKTELVEGFGVKSGRITVIPFGINNAVPNTDLSPAQAKQRLGIGSHEKTILFFGRITPYKGLEYLIDAYRETLRRDDNYRLIIAGKLERGCEQYWQRLEEVIRRDFRNDRVTLRIQFIPDEETEIYFKAADVLVLPYRDVYQSGVLFLALSFGLPVVAANVGSLKDEIVEGETGFVFGPEDPVELAETIEKYFASDLFADLEERRPGIRAFSMRHHSWDVVGRITMNIYNDLLASRAGWTL